ncbi:hypothetical protein MHBO_000019 [Bonamia ostreae]|uniref:GTP-binding protein sar1 n=1 Tax=Bonamia ostreae TaxID=126728 RepID=A0ABV2AES3_9EUKA
MIFLDWFNSILTWAGFRKDSKIVFLGLDNAGKTTLLSVLKVFIQIFKDGNVKAAAPTGHPQKDEIQIAGVNFIAFDLGGHKSMREIWESYCADISGIIYLVDAADQERFEESKQELQRILTLESLNNVPVCILGNKVDNPYAASEETLKDVLDLRMCLTGKNAPKTKDIRPVELFMCSVVKRFGYDKGFKWIVKNC